MGIMDKIANAKKTSWVVEGLTEDEVKSIIELSRISAQIEKCRLELEMTQKEFADYMGVSQGMVSKWESRDYNFTIKSLNEICHRLGMSLEVNVEKYNIKKEYNIIKWDEERFTHRNKKVDVKNKWQRYVNDEEGVA